MALTVSSRTLCIAALAAAAALCAAQRPARAEAAPDDRSFIPTSPAGGAVYSPSAPPAHFAWTDGGFERFRVEFSPNPDFSRPVFHESAGFSSGSTYAPSARAWEQIRELGRCGRPVYWRIVAKIPGAIGVVTSDRPSWLAFEPGRNAARVLLDVAGEALAGQPLTFTLRASSTECPMTGARIDFDGDGWWDAVGPADGSGALTVSYAYGFDTTGPHMVHAEVLSADVPIASTTAEIVTMATTTASVDAADLGASGAPGETLVCTAAPLLASLR